MINLKINLAVDDRPDMHSVIDWLTENYFTFDVSVDSDGHFEGDDEPTAEDVIAVLAKMNLSHDNRLSRMRDELVDMAERGGSIELSVRDGFPAVTLDDVTDTDPTPPHGIERPGYWIDRSRSPTQGSGRKQPNLEAVPCPACGAPEGYVCMAASHAAYRKGYGHSQRYVAFRQR